MNGKGKAVLTILQTVSFMKKIRANPSSDGRLVSTGKACRKEHIGKIIGKGVSGDYVAEKTKADDPSAHGPLD